MSLSWYASLLVHWDHCCSRVRKDKHAHDQLSHSTEFLSPLGCIFNSLAAPMGRGRKVVWLCVVCMCCVRIRLLS